MQMSSVMYPAIHAKLNGMYAQKLKKADLEELMKQNTINQAIALLKNLNSSFKDLEDNSRRIRIKILLDDILIKDIKKICGLLNQAEKQIFLQFISMYEIKCVKSVFRRLSSGSVINEQTNEVENWTTKLFKNLAGIENVKDYEQFLQIIKRTKYFSIFAKYSENIEEINVFEIENSLDKFYFEKMMQIARKHNKNLEAMIGKQIDLNNILWIYRVKKNYDFSEEQIRNILIQVHYKLKKSELEKLIQAGDEKDIKEILQETFYAKYINFEDTEDLEEQVNKYLYQIYKKCFRSNIFEMSSIYAYINMIEQENNDIMNIVEGIRYHLNRDEIRKKLL